ncbi:MAG: YfhO family protein, partial [Bacteroidales bacterium]|nr:YfhO family protein [Bacteroidales bacterium]
MENKFSVFFRKNTVLVLSGMILLVGMMSMWQFFSLDRLFVFTDFADDSYTSYLPQWFVDESLSHEGLLSTYSFYHAAGNSYVQNIPLDPIGFVMFWIGRLMLSLFGVKGLAITYFYGKFLISFLGTGIFTYLWIRELNVGRFASMLAGIFAAFSGGIVVLSIWNIEMYGFYLAFYLFSIEQILHGRRRYFMAIAAAMLASQPYQLYLCSLFIAIYLIFRMILLKYSFKKAGVTVLWVVGMGLLGLLVNLPSLLNSLTIQLNTPRMTGANDINDFSTSFLVDGEMMSSLILRLFGHNIINNEFFISQWNNFLEAPAIYCGIITLLVFPQIFLYISNRKRILYASFLGFWLMVLLINPLRQLILLHAGDYFRYGINFFFIFMMLMLMAQSLNVLATRRRLNLPLLLVTGVLCFMLLWIHSGNIAALDFIEGLQNIWIMYFGIALMLLNVVLLVLLNNSSNRQLAKVLICSLSLFEVFVLTDSVFDGRSCVSTIDLDLSKANYDNGISSTLDDIRSKDSSQFYRVITDHHLGKSRHTSSNYNQVLGFFSTMGYNSFNQPEYVRFLQSIGMACPDVEGDSRWIQGVNYDLFSMNFMGVKYLISNKLDTINVPKPLLANSSHWQCGNNMVFRFNNPFPLGFTVDKYMTDDEFRQLLTFTVRQPHFDHVIKRLNDAGLQPREDVEAVFGKLLDMKFSSYDDIKEFLYPQMPAEYAHWVAAGLYYASHESYRQSLALLFLASVSPDSDLDLSGFQHIDVADIMRPDYLSSISNDKYDSIAKSAISESLEVSSFAHNHIKGSISVSKDKLMVLTIPYDKAWHCKVDGHDCSLSKFDVGFSGLRLPAGKHEIELSYEPLYRNAAIWISIIAALLMYVFVIYNIISSWQAL